MSNSALLLKSRPAPHMEAANFALETVAEPDAASLAAGHVLVELICVSVDPYMRGRMNDQKGYFVGPFQIDHPIEGGAVLRVIASQADNLQPGDLVQTLAPFKLRQILPAAGLQKLPANTVTAATATEGFPAHYFLGVLGLTGLSAYLPLLEIGKPKAGETLFVSGAAGAVGSVVGQIAKILGLRVLGSAGSDEKVRFLREELGFDAAYNYKTETANEFLTREAPEGVDIYFDNVGGDTLDHTLLHMRLNGRIVGCGAISQYDVAPENRYGVKNLFAIVTKRLTFQGFIVMDLIPKYPTAHAQLAQWVGEGKIKSRETLYHGIDKIPEAFLGLFQGANTGKAIILIQ
eukprot:TRINITY_DN1457_c0_g1_i1.p1 TRINITY_DN1457_c0_g1~~TRINITY_DN1457_c0_g1_i1.p1  ORF type:complete len:347 (-),score=66.74 TRINITY_DN1457_c0_g1_i1:505-1545(-)